MTWLSLAEKRAFSSWWFSMKWRNDVSPFRLATSNSLGFHPIPISMYALIGVEFYYSFHIMVRLFKHFSSAHLVPACMRNFHSGCDPNQFWAVSWFSAFLSPFGCTPGSGLIWAAPSAHSVRSSVHSAPMTQFLFVLCPYLILRPQSILPHCFSSHGSAHAQSYSKFEFA